MSAGEFGLRYWLQTDPCQCPTCVSRRAYRARLTAPTLPPSSRQRGPFPAKAAHDRRISSADETDLRDDGGMDDGDQ